LQRTRPLAFALAARLAAERLAVNSRPSGAQKRLFSVALLLMTTSGLRAETIMSMGPSPAGKALRLIASGTVSAELLGDPILEAAEYRRPEDVMPRLLDVLDAYSREGEAEANRVTDSFVLASEKAKSTAPRKIIEKSAETLRLRLKSRPQYAKPPLGWFQHEPGIPLNVPFTAKSSGEWGQYVFHDRLASHLERFLPKEDRRAYVREALHAYLSTSCETLLEGKVVSVCQQVGLFPLRYEALRLAFGGLRSDGTDPSVADLYLSQGAETLEQVLAGASLIHPGGFSRECSILSKWLQRAPSRWDVWADLEPELR